MKKNIAIKIFIIMLVALFVIAFIPKEILAITPGDITGKAPEDAPEIGESFLNNTTDLIRTIGMFIAVGAMMVIGIKYMTGSAEEKANYKKTMMPYITRMYTAIWSFNNSTDDNKYIFRCKRNRRHRKSYIRCNSSSWNSHSNFNAYDTWN